MRGDGVEEDYFIKGAVQIGEVLEAIRALATISMDVVKPN